MMYVLTNPGKNDDAFLENAFLPLQDLERSQFSLVSDEWFNRLTEDDYGLEAVDLQDADEEVINDYLEAIKNKEWIKALDILLQFHYSGYISEYIQATNDVACVDDVNIYNACLDAGMIQIPVLGQIPVIFKASDERGLDICQDSILDSLEDDCVFQRNNEEQIEALFFEWEIAKIVYSIRSYVHDDYTLFCLHAPFYEQEEAPDGSILVIW